MYHVFERRDAVRTLNAVFAASFVIALAAGPAAGQDEPSPTWRAGVASVVITPDVPIWMAGYAARTKPAEGKLQDLHAKALAFEDPAGRRAVLVTTDLVGIPRDIASAVCERIRMHHGLSREAILLAASHTHSGPVVGNNLRPAHRLDDKNRMLVDAYTESLKTRLVETAAAALADLTPADLAWGTGHATFAVNRRENPDVDVPNRRTLGRLTGPVDHDVPTLAVRQKDGTLRAVLFGYACHATVLDGYEWSGDYPGFAQQAIENSRPGVTALFFAGCGADQNPIPRRSVPPGREVRPNPRHRGRGGSRRTDDAGRGNLRRRVHRGAPSVCRSPDARSTERKPQRSRTDTRRLAPSCC